MDLLTAAWLGTLQGLTEFLPVSSSAHLLLARALLGGADRFGLGFDVACHAGTLVAVAAYFRRDVAAMLAAVPEAFTRRPGPPARLVRLVAVGTVPVVVIGGVAGAWIEAHLRTPAVAGAALGLGGVLLLAAERLGRQAAGETSLTPVAALLIGAAQAAALVPGVSRAGATITVGLLVGLRRDAAARFAFVLSMPAILAAAVKEGVAAAGAPLAASDAGLAAVGAATSAVVGYFTVKYFLRFLAVHRLDVFGWYRIVAAAAIAVWLVGR